MAESFTTKPRRVWTGMTVPGKKLVALAEKGGLSRGRTLLALYENSVEALVASAFAIEFMRGRGVMFGPALRDIGGGLEPAKLYGAILTDIRDFLKLRFRTTASAEPPVDNDVESAVRHAIHVLDEASRSSDSVDWDALGQVRDSLTEAGENLASFEEALAYESVFKEFRRLRGQPPSAPD